jgi:hypothetical protein
MINTSVPAVHRIALYDHVRNRRVHYQQQAFKLLGGKCANCECAEGLRLRFLHHGNSLAKKYQHSPSTLHRRICREPELRKEINLLCRACRLAAPRSDCLANNVHLTELPSTPVAYDSSNIER